MDFLHFDLIQLVSTVGVWGVVGIIFIETGIIFGFFFPGDSLLFTAGFLASQNFFNVTTFIIFAFIASIVGNCVGYLFGKKVGEKLFTKEDSLFFKKSYLEKTKHFFDEHGNKTIFFARFFPIIRTFAPVLAGIGAMPLKPFLFYTIFGGAVWICGLTLLGYFLGKTIPDVDKYLLPIIAGIVIISVLPGLVHILKKPVVNKQ